MRDLFPSVIEYLNKYVIRELKFTLKGEEQRRKYEAFQEHIMSRPRASMETQN